MDELRIQASMVGTKTLMFRVVGELDAVTSEQLIGAMGEWLGIRECVIDLTACGFVDASGIRALLLCQQAIDPDGTMRLVGVAPNVERTLRSAGLQSVLEISAGPD